MKHERYDMSILLDFYGDLLTAKQKFYFDSYYNQDLSLAEIAEQEGISRQAVHDMINRAENTMVNAEKAVGYMEKTSEVRKACQELEKAVAELKKSNDPSIQQLADTMLVSIAKIKE